MASCRTVEAQSRVLIVGVGGIGGTVAGSLIAGRAPCSVVGVSTNRDVVSSVSQRGFRLTGVDGDRAVPGEVVEALPDATDPFDFVLLATQPPQVEAAARAAAPFLADDGVMVVLCNGLCEPRVAEIVPDRVLGGVVAWGASMTEPGAYERTSAGGFTLGRLDGRTDDPALERLSMLLEHVGPVDVTDNLAGARWSKLAINCAISSLGTIGGDRLGVLMRARIVRRLALEIMTEVVAVARREEVRLRKVSGTIDLDWMALTAAERATTMGSASLVAKHSLLLAVGTRYRRLRSSMLRAIERGREPAVAFLNGEISSRGERHGVPTPVNDAIAEQVRRISRGERTPSMDAIAEVGRELGLL